MTCGFESIKVQSVATPKHAVQIEVSEEGGQLGNVCFHAAKLRGTNILHDLYKNSLFNGTFSSTNQMVKIRGRGGGGGDQIFQGEPFISAGKRGTKCFKRESIFSENIGPPGPFFLKYLVQETVFGGDQLLRDRPPIKTLYLRSGGAIILTLMVGGARASASCLQCQGTWFYHWTRQC